MVYWKVLKHSQATYWQQAGYKIFFKRFIHCVLNVQRIICISEVTDIANNSATWSVYWLWRKTGGFVVPPEIYCMLKRHRVDCLSSRKYFCREANLPPSALTQKRAHKLKTNPENYFTSEFKRNPKICLWRTVIAEAILGLSLTFQPRHQHDAYTRASPWTITPPAPRGRWRRWWPDFCGLFFI